MPNPRLMRLLGGGAAKQFNPLTDLPPPSVWVHGEFSGQTKHSTFYTTQWNDLSGNNNHAATTDGASTMFEDGAQLNGHNCIWSNGTASTGVMETGWTPTGRDVYIIAAVKRGIITTADTGSTVRPIAGFTDGASVGTHHSNTVEAELVVRGWDGGTVLGNSASGSFPVGRFAIIVYQLISGSSMRVWLDGVEVITETSGIRDGALGEFFIGGTGVAERRFQGYLGEIIAGEGILTDAQVKAVSSYMRYWKPPLRLSVPWNFTDITTVISDGGFGQGCAVSATDDVIFGTGNPSQDDILIYNYTTLALEDTVVTTGTLGVSHTQVNGLHYVESTNKLYVGANNFNTTPAAGWVAEYDYDPALRTLTFVELHDMGANWAEGGCFLSDGRWINCYTEIKNLRIYDSSFEFIASTGDVPAGAPLSNHWFQSLTVTSEDVISTNMHGGGSYGGWLHQFVIMPDNSLGSAFYRVRPPNQDTDQGVFYDGTYYWWAERTANNATTNNHLKRATPVFSLMDVG